jgi:hypothetical protein
MPSFPMVIDNSLLKEFKECPQKCFRTYFEHHKPRKASVHLHAGAAFAHGLEAVRKYYYEQGLPQAECLEYGLQELLRFYGSFECPDDSPKSAIRMAQALEYYFSAWPLLTDTAVPASMPSGKRAIEFSFAEPLPIDHPETGEPLIYCGRSDMIVEMSNGLFIEDDKTTGALGASWSNQWDLRSQFTGYCWAARNAHIPVDGVLVRGVAILKTMFKHEQYLTYRPQWEVDRWLHQTLRDITRMIDCWRTGEWDYNLADACSNYGGCSYLKVCKASNPQEWLDMYFEQRIWDPLTRTETKI